MKRDLTTATLLADAKEFVVQFASCELSLIIIEGETVSEFHSHNPRETLDRFSTILIDDECEGKCHQDPFGGDVGSAFTKSKNALFRDLISFSCQRDVNCALVCFDSQGAVYDYSDPGFSEVLGQYFEMGGGNQFASVPSPPSLALPDPPRQIFNLFTQYSQGMLAQETLAVSQQRRVDSLERSNAAMQRAIDERDQELGALNKAMQEMNRLNMALEDKVAVLEAENARLRLMFTRHNGSDELEP
eukprot:GGOE01036386.1.p1 GENE.GGOE01036386.1~~GGOE01036386.1.p1  ORF type:complete len:245 (+),score=68.14 GGOE01036386.1:62-796(+)